MDRLLAVCRFFVSPGDGSHFPSMYIPHYRDEAKLPDGRPKVSFLNNYLGFDITEAERDAAWEEAVRLGNAPLTGRERDIIEGYYFDDR